MTRIAIWWLAINNLVIIFTRARLTNILVIKLFLIYYLKTAYIVTHGYINTPKEFVK